MSQVDVISEVQEDVLIYNLLPSQDTDGTTYDYFVKFPNMNEEVYYMLECVTLQNIDESKLVEVCQSVVDQRNEKLLYNFNNSRKPNELDINIQDIDYNINNEFGSNHVSTESVQHTEP